MLPITSIRTTLFKSTLHAVTGFTPNRLKLGWISIERKVLKIKQILEDKRLTRSKVNTPCEKAINRYDNYFVHIANNVWLKRVIF